MLVAQTNALLDLAKSREPADRERLLMNVVSLCELAGPGGDAEAVKAKALIDEVFMTLVIDAEREVRRRLAERIAGVDWAPRALVHVLTLDDIEIARPVIASSPLLDDGDLIRLLVEATLEHQVEVARRPGIGPAVALAILDKNEPSLLAALADNVSAVLPDDGIARLVEASRLMPALRAPLTRHPQLTTDLACTLYAWVGEALREALAGRFRLDPQALNLAVDDAVHDATVEPFGRPVTLERAEERAATERRLVHKLNAAGQLKPGYLLRALREHKLSLFEAGLAQLAGLNGDHLHAALNCDRPEILALACHAAGIDRSVFPTVLARVRELNRGLPSGGGEGDARASAVFQHVAAEEAVLAFNRMIQVIAPI
ncbi:MAG: hypothetical protein JWO72_1576 [Caulobacteraceae bacterium]|nr:hypothetical protein [Caulobacteraceae bacterium]